MSRTVNKSRKQNKIQNKQQNKRKTRKNDRSITIKGGKKCDTKFIINFIKNEFREKLKNVEGDYGAIYLESDNNKFVFEISIKKVEVHHKNININERLKLVLISGFSLEKNCEKKDVKIFTELLKFFIQETIERGYDGIMIDELTLNEKEHRKEIIKKLGFINANEYETPINKEYVLLFKDYSSFTIDLPRIDTRKPRDFHRSRSTSTRRKLPPPKTFEEFISPLSRLSPPEIPESPDRPFFPMDEDKYEIAPDETYKEVQLRKDMERIRNLYLNDK
jgi:hypothetical protein